MFAMIIELYTGNPPTCKGTCAYTVSDDLYKLFWIAVYDKKNIIIYYNNIAMIIFDYYKPDNIWYVCIQWNHKCTNKYQTTIYKSCDLDVPIKQTENRIKYHHKKGETHHHG